jgi:hypothetical protein
VTPPDERGATGAGSGGSRVPGWARLITGLPAELSAQTDTKRGAPGAAPHELRLPRSGEGGAGGEPPAPGGANGDGGLPGRPRRRLLRPGVVGGALACLLAGLGAGWMVRGAGVDLSTQGPADRARLGPGALKDLAFIARSGDETALETSRLTLDGVDVTGKARLWRGQLLYEPEGLSEGWHRLELRVDQSLPWQARRSWTFAVDRRKPALRLLSGATEARRYRPVRLVGRVSEPAAVAVNGRRMRVRNGRFAVRFHRPPPRPVKVAAVDLAGNRTLMSVPVMVTARRPKPPVRAVHMTAISWALPSFRTPILELLRQGKLTAIELDLKDEGGTIGWDSRNRLGRRIGAVEPRYSLRKAVKQIHAMGGRVIGRLVVFQDPVLAKAAWVSGKRAQVVQTPDGKPYAARVGYTNPANVAVQRYNVEIAREAAAAGVDEILYDYVRRPDGPPAGMRFPGFKGNVDRPVLQFLSRSQKALRPYKVFTGASVFGIAATRPNQIAQNVPLMARRLDYVAPMVYPALWTPGEYDVPQPNRQPGMIVDRSLKDFKRQVDGTGARLVPWLQDFSLGYQYGPREVRAQIDAARANGIREWLLWDPRVSYTAAALPGG